MIQMAPSTTIHFPNDEDLSRSEQEEKLWSQTIRNCAHENDTACITPEKAKIVHTAVEKVSSKQRPTFPRILHQLLGEASIKDFEHIVSWLPCGRIFRVHDIKAFEKITLCTYFNQTRYRSFLRQLNMYGFKRVPIGIEKKRGYTHSMLNRKDVSLCRFITRVGMKRAMKASPMSASNVLDGSLCTFPVGFSSAPTPFPILNIYSVLMAHHTESLREKTNDPELHIGQPRLFADMIPPPDILDAIIDVFCHE
jgi:hypothetical protein